MRPIEDHRFDGDAWPFDFTVPANAATDWMAHLDAECEARQWRTGGLSQLEPDENSGSITIETSFAGSCSSLQIVWEKGRGEGLIVRARPGGTPPLGFDAAREFFKSIEKRVNGHITMRSHRRAWLMYDVLPWRGELWLDSDLRLGPPSQYPNTTFGPQIVVVDAMVEGIGSKGVTTQFQRTLLELRIFLAIVLGGLFRVVQCERGWVYETDDQGRIRDCRLAALGYAEVRDTPGFPTPGSSPPNERRTVARPGIGKVGYTIGICADMHERWVPDDIEALWQLFRSLPVDKREQFMKAGNASLIAKTMWPDQRTAYASFLVVACESLKPKGRKHHSANIYDVVESLVGAGRGVALRTLSIAPQRVRSDLFHRGDLLAGELGAILLADPFHDPSFHNMLDVLATDARIAIIEWLRCRGDYRLVRVPRQQLTLVARLRNLLDYILSGRW